MLQKPCLFPYRLTSLLLFTFFFLLMFFGGYFSHCRLHSDVLNHFVALVSDRHVDRPSDKFLIVGDFNVTQAHWNSSAEDEHFIISETEPDTILLKLVRDCLSYTDFKQYKNVLNFNNRLLDLILSDSICNVRRSSEPLVPEDKHHPALQ